MKRRINIASSLLHRPKILLMDEPTVGVDPQSRNHIFEVIERLNGEGLTIIYTTHYMEEAERLCNTIAIIDLGKIVAMGDLTQLREQSGAKDLLTITFEDINQELTDKLQEAVPMGKLNLESKTLEVDCSDLGREISGIVNSIHNTGEAIQSIDTNKANLEAVFLKLTGKQLRD